MIERMQPAQVAVVGLGPYASAGIVGMELRRDFHFKLPADAGSDLILDGQRITGIAVIGLGPEVQPGTGIDELRRDPHPLSGAPDAAFHDVGRPKRTADTAQVLSLSLVAE